MPDKKYLIEIPDMPEGSGVWDADRWERNKDLFMKDNPDAKVFEIGEYDPEDSQEHDQIMLSFEDEEKSGVWDNARWERNKDLFMQDNPDAVVNRVRYVDYWGQKAEENRARKNELMQPDKQRNAKLAEMGYYDDLTGGQVDFEFNAPSTIGLQPLSSAIKTNSVSGETEYLDPKVQEFFAQDSAQTDRMAEIAKLDSEYDENPAVIEYRKMLAEQQAEQDAYADKRVEAIKSEIEKIDSFKAARGAALKRNMSEEIPFQPLYETVAGKEAESGQENEKLEKYMTALKFYEKANYVREHGGKGFVNGVALTNADKIKSLGYGAADTFKGMALDKATQSDLEAYNEIGGILSNLEKKLGNLKEENITPEVLEKNLSKEDMELILAFFEYNRTRSDAKKDMSKWYKGGKIFAESVPYMLEFLVTGGLYEGASKAGSNLAKKGLTKALAGLIYKMGAKRAAAVVSKTGKALAGAALGTLARTLVAPGTYKRMAEATTQIDDEGHMHRGKDAFKSFVDAYIENLSEISGGLIGKGLGIVGKGAGAILAKTPLAKYGQMLGDTRLMQLLSKGWTAAAPKLKQLGFHGFPEEIGEEFIGNAIREITIQPGALKEMVEDDNFGAMIIGFAPTTFFGAGVGAVNVGYVNAKASSLGKSIREMFSHAYGQENIDHMMSVMQSAETPEQMQQAVKPIAKAIRQAEAQGMITKDQANYEIETLYEYAGYMASNKALLFGQKEQDRKLAEAKEAEYQQKFGKFWQENEEGEKSVQIAKLNNGKTVFVVSAPEADGQVSIVDATTGKHGYANIADIATQEVEVEGEKKTESMTRTTSVDDFINERIAMERQSSERNRMLRERQAQIDALAKNVRPGTKLNLGTEGMPINVFVKGTNQAGVVVVDQNGGQNTLGWEQVADFMGQPIRVKTDQEISDEMVDAKVAEWAKRRKASRSASPLVQSAAENASVEAANVVAEEQKHIPMNEDGTVNEVAFWEQDPEGFAKWNDEQNKDGGQDTLQQIAMAKIELTALLDEQVAAQNTSNPTLRKAAKAEAARLAERIARIGALEQSYMDTLQEEKKQVEQTKARPTAEMTEQDLEQMDQQYQNIFGKTKVRAERVRVMQEYLDKISEESAPVVLLTAQDYAERLAKEGVSEAAIAKVTAQMKQGKVAGFMAKGKTFIMYETIPSVDEARITYVHERQHELNKQDLTYVKAMVDTVHRMGGKKTMLKILEAFVGKKAMNAYKGLGVRGLADEIICRAMEIAYSNADFSVALQQLGVPQEVINIIEQIDNEQRGNRSLAHARRRGGRTAHADLSGRENAGENGRDNRQVSGGLLGEQGSGSAGSGERGTEAGRAGEPGAVDSDENIPLRVITPEEDAAYLDAVKAGDLETAQNMVLEAAKRAMPNTKVVDENGNPKIVYHGTPWYGFNSFMPYWGLGYPIYFAEDETFAEEFSHKMDEDYESFDEDTKKQFRRGVYPVFVNAENPLNLGNLDAGAMHEDEKYDHVMEQLGLEEWQMDAYAEQTRFGNLYFVLDTSKELNDLIRERGYDSVFGYQDGSSWGNQWGVYDPSSIKSAAPVTYDQGGNVIPLSERFNMDKDDVNFRTIDDMPEANLSEDTKTELNDKGLVMEGGAIMSEEYAALKHEAGYATPNERNIDTDDVRFSVVTKDAWKANYLQHPEAEARVANQLDLLAQRMVANEFVNSVISHGEHKYGKAEKGSFAGPLRTNDEYVVTFDMDTTCPRTFQFLEYVKKIERRVGRPLTQVELIQLTEMMRMYGQMIPCVYCYAENKRQALKESYSVFMNARYNVLKAKTDEEAIEYMYGHKANKTGTNPDEVLTEAAAKVFRQWRAEAGKAYNPTMPVLYRQYMNDRDSILSLLDFNLSLGKINANMSDDAITKKIVADLRVTDVKASRVIGELVEEWKWDTIEGKEHDDFHRVDEDDMWVNEQALSVWRDMTSYAKSSSSAKTVVRYTPYTDELKKLSQEQRDHINGMGGVRMHSTNDFRIDYVFDYFQFMADMAANKMLGHTYTKSPEFVRIFGNSGYKINMSIAAYQDSDGNVRPNVDEGFDWKEAQELRRFFPNAGVMLMATSDEQLQMALDSEWIDMCIPFHKSGLPKVVWYNMRLWKDYEPVQKELFYNNAEMKQMLIEDGVEIPKGAGKEQVEQIFLEHFNITVLTDEKGERIKPHFLPGPSKDKGVDIPGHYNDHQTYLDLCRQYGVKPRFKGVKVKDNSPEGQGRTVDITEHPSYMKVIKETARTDTPQTPVQFNFDQPSEALGGRTPIDYAFEELETRAMAESQIAGGKVGDIYNSLKQDPYGIVNQFMDTIIKHKKETGKDYPLDYLTPDSREWFMVQRKALEEAFQGVNEIPYHRNVYDEQGNLIEGVGLENARKAEEERIAAEEKAAKEAEKAAKKAAREAERAAKKAAKKGAINLMDEAAKAVEGEVMMRFIGEQGAARLDAAYKASNMVQDLDVAKDMEQAGKDAKAIKAATGWERGADRKWRYETKDFEFKGKPGTKTSFKLSELIKDIKLFKAYPELKDVRVRYTKLPKGIQGQVATERGKTEIKISIDQYKAQNPVIAKAAAEFIMKYPDVFQHMSDGTATPEERALFINTLAPVFDANDHYVDEFGGKNTLIHEIQHVIQDIEGFAKGGSKNMVDLSDPGKRRQHAHLKTRLKEEHNTFQDLQDQRTDVFKRGVEQVQKGNRAEALALRQEYDRLLKEQKLSRQRILGIEMMLKRFAKLGKEGYRRLAGEVESRIAEARMDMTDEQRRQSLMTDTIAEMKEVATEDQIFIMDNIMMGYDEMMSNNVSFRITPEEDAEYMKAVEEGDMATAERLVSEAAERWAKDSKVRGEDYEIYSGQERKPLRIMYHGTEDTGFTVFNTDPQNNNIGSHFGSRVAGEEFASRHDENAKLYKAYLNITNPLETFDWFGQDDAYPLTVAEEIVANMPAGEARDKAQRLLDEMLKFPGMEWATGDLNTDLVNVTEYFLTNLEDHEDYYQRLREIIILAGYDGLVYGNDLEDYDRENGRVNVDYIALYPEQIKSAEAITYDNDGNVIPLSERFNPENDDVRFSIIGEIGALYDKTSEGEARLQNLETARQMEQELNPDWTAKENEAALKIKIATGWERGADGLWRYEIEDIKIKPIKDWLFSKKKLKLGDIVENGELLRLYPDLADINIIKKKGKYDLGASYSHKENHMTLPFGALKDDIAQEWYWGKETFEKHAVTMYDDIIHEVQHAIQSREGFARGGNERMVHPQYRQQYNDLTKRMMAVADEYNAMSGVERDEPYGVGLRQFFNDMNRQRNKYILGTSGYRRLAGESEARNVEHRKDYTLEQRRNTLLASTEDVAREDLIFILDSIPVTEEMKESVMEGQVMFRTVDINEDVQAEMAEIKERTKADGTFMKAPNGRATNLTEEQWLMVRTKNFLNWFGDWKKPYRIEKLRNSQSVIMKGDEYIGKYELNRESARDYIMREMRDQKYSIGDTRDEITIVKKGAKKVTSHSMKNDAHIRSLAIIPELFKSAIFITEMPADKSDAHYDSYRYYVCGLEYNGESYTVKLTVGEKGGQYYYDHHLTAIEKGKLLDLINSNQAVDLKGFKATAEESDSSYALSEVKDTKLISILQDNSSKVVDENGEPKVVYHQTNSVVYINRETGENWDELDWRARQEWDERDDWDEYWEEQDFNTFSRVNARTTNELDGFFFAPEYDEYHEYGDRTIPAFLNIKNPASREDYNIDSSINNAGREERIRLQNEGFDGVIREEDGMIWEYVAFEPNQIKSATENTGEYSSEDADIRYKVVTDQAEIDAFEASEKIKGYRNVVMLEDGSFEPPMANSLRNTGKEKVKTSGFKMNEIEKAEENPDLADENGKIDLVKPDGKSVDKVDYNPYIHNRRSLVNSQFKQAWERPNLVYIETEIALDDINSGYHADKAKKPVGIHKWNGGPLVLSRYDRPVRIVPWSEVANDWVKKFKKKGVHFDIVPPALRPILVERGVKILPPHKNMGANCFAAYEAWKNGENPNGPDGGVSFRMKDDVQLSRGELREIAGDIFEALPEGRRSEITSRLRGNILGLQDAIMQIPTDLAVKEQWSDEDKATAKAVKDAVIAATGISLTAKEALWTLYNANNKGTDLMSEASRALVKRNLGFSQAAAERHEMEDDYIRFRTVRNDMIDATTDMYNYEASLWTERLKESWLDMNQSVESLQKALAKGSGMEIEPWENVVLALNRLSSKSYADKKKYMRDFLNPMWDAVIDVMEKAKLKVEDVERYMMLKHGLERNRIFAARDAKEFYRSMYGVVAERMKNQSHAQQVVALSEAKKALDEIDAKMANAKDAALARLQESRRQAEQDVRIAELVLRGDEKQNEQDLQDRYEAIDAGLDAKYMEFREKDYGGLTSMFVDVTPVKRSEYRSEEAYHKALLAGQKPKYTTVADMEKQAQQEVDDFENKVNTEELWKRTEAATKETLRHQHASGMITDEQYDAVRDMFEYYVPLRGFADNTAEDMYSYYMTNSAGGFAKPIIAAKGRTTRAESPLGWIGTMAESAIQADNKNDAKMCLYYAVLRRPDQALLSITDTWYEAQIENGKKVFRPVYPPATDKALTAEELRDHLEKWEDDMKKKQAAGMAYKGSQRVNLKESVVFQDAKQEPEHIVRVKVAGQDYSIIVNGNPRAAQAINGLLNPDANLGPVGEWIAAARRNLSALLTSYSPLFWVANFQRDLLSSFMRVSESDGWAQAFRYLNNRRNAWRVASYIYKYDNGTMGDSYYEQMYKEFAENGGVTGYTALTKNKEYEKLFEDYARRMGRPVSRAVKGAWEKFMGFGEAIEQVSRFAAYLTAREAGKSIEEAVYAAKEVSVNFNRKGSAKPISMDELDKLRTKSGKPLNKMQRLAAIIFSAMPKGMKALYYFFNASIQATSSTANLAKKSPGKAAAWAGMYFGMSLVMAAINYMLSGGDDDEEYIDLPDYLRESTLLVSIGDGYYLKWSIPQEMRPFYAYADLIMRKRMGKMPHKNLALEMALATAQWLPVNPFDSEDPLLSLVPDFGAPIAEAGVNKTSFGGKVYNDMPFKSEEVVEQMPAYRKATSKTGKVYIDMAEFLNDVTGGDEVQKGWANINPAVVEHLVEGYGGGVYDFAKMMVSIPGMVLSDDPVQIKDIPFVNKVLLSTDETNMYTHTNEAYNYYRTIADNAKRVEGEYRASDDPARADAYRSEEDYRIYLLHRQYEDDFKDVKERIDAAVDDEEIALLRKEQNVLREMFLDDIAQNTSPDPAVQIAQDVKLYEKELRERLKPVTDADKERLARKKARDWKGMNRARKQRDSLKRLPEFKEAEQLRKDLRELKKRLEELNTMETPAQRDSFLDSLQIDYDDFVKRIGTLK